MTAEGTIDHEWRTKKVKRDVYEARMAELQIELVRMQYWVKQQGVKVVLVFEGRDAAGKGGTIKRLTEPLNPRGATVVALPAPSDREQSQWYFQRYVTHLPAAGEIVIFDRSWYNRGGVERVLGFCTKDEHAEWMRSCPEFERMLVRSGIVLLKYWFSVSDAEQERRFQERAQDPLKRWKLSPMDLKSREKWVEFSKAKDEMFAVTDIPRGALVHDRIRRQARRAAELHHPRPRPDPLPGRAARPDRAPAAAEATSLQATAEGRARRHRRALLGARHRLGVARPARGDLFARRRVRERVADAQEADRAEDGRQAELEDAVGEHGRGGEAERRAVGDEHADQAAFGAADAARGRQEGARVAERVGEDEDATAAGRRRRRPGRRRPRLATSAAK